MATIKRKSNAGVDGGKKSRVMAAIKRKKLQQAAMEVEEEVRKRKQSVEVEDNNEEVEKSAKMAKKRVKVKRTKRMMLQLQQAKLGYMLQQAKLGYIPETIIAVEKDRIEKEIAKLSQLCTGSLRK